MENYSVLMSVYHGEKAEYLRLSANSILSQTVPTNDFVLMCDGPLTEELDAVIEDLLREHSDVLHVIRLEENRGLGDALNAGIQYCKNELIARMDSDDIDQKVIDNVKPDVIFVEITERMVSQLQYTSEEFLHYSAEVTNEDILNIRYCDFGAYEKMLFPIWSEENHQDDLIWYEPVRVDENHWELQVDLNQHRSNGVYHIHFYSVSGNDGREYVTSKTFDVGTRFE